MKSSTQNAQAMHILFGGVGGQLAVVRDIVAHWSAKEISSVVVAIAPEDSFSAHLEQDLRGIPVVRVPVSRRLWGGLHVNIAIDRALREWRPRIVFWHSAYGAMAVLRYRYFRSGNQILLIPHQSPSLMKVRHQLRALLASAICHRVVYLTEAYKHTSPIRVAPWRSVKDAAVINNGVNLNAFSPMTARKRRDSGLTVGTLGRLIASKDVATLIRGFSAWRQGALDSEGRLLIAGDGPERHALEELVAELGITAQVGFLGNIRPADVTEFLRSLDIYVHPTLGETMSTSIMQAYAVGLPVIASRVPGVDNMVEDGFDGLLVPARAPEMIATALRRLETEPEFRAKLGLAARRRAVRDWSSEVMAERYLQLFSEALNPDPQGASPSSLTKTEAEADR